MDFFFGNWPVLNSLWNDEEFTGLKMNVHTNQTTIHTRRAIVHLRK